MRIAAWLTLLAGAAASLAAQPVTKAQSGGSKVGVLHVQANVYLVYGAGANITAQVGDQIVTLVDSGLPEYSEEVRAAIRSVSNKPIGYIINTGIDKDHTGGNGNLAKGGFFMLESANESRPQASVVSHLRLLERMSEPEDPEDKAAAIPSSSWPTDTYGSADWKLYANGEPIILEHPLAAHSDADSIVFFRKSDVVSTGDIFDMTKYPMIDVKRGGSLQGILNAQNHVLKDITVAKNNEEGGTYVIPGHGRVCDRNDLANYRDMLTIIRDRIQDLVNKGKTLEQVKAAKPTYDYDGGYGVDNGPWTTSMFIESVYRELRKKEK
jgi:glyoxylase-like metal-dependent hydrolase (beta-lactamase superfamily II)